MNLGRAFEQGLDRDSMRSNKCDLSEITTKTRRWGWRRCCSREGRRLGLSAFYHAERTDHV